MNRIFHCLSIYFSLSISLLTDRITKRIPLRLLRHRDIINANIEDVKNDYIFAMKKSVVDFVLGEAVENTNSLSLHATKERKELRSISKRFSNK